MKKIFLLLSTLLIVACDHKSYKVPTPSMAGTLNVGDNILVKDSKDFSRNQIVIFNREIENGKSTPYVKRLIGMPGDSLEIIDGEVAINDTLLEFPEKYHTSYILIAKMVLPKRFFEKEKITDFYEISRQTSIATYIVHIAPSQAENLRKNPSIISVKPEIFPKGKTDSMIFPQSSLFDWSADNFGKLWIPKKGSVIKINEYNLALYGKIILKNEDNPDAFIEKNKLYINRKEKVNYIFKHDYFFVMGDSRHNSEDSRYLGLIADTDMTGYVVEEFLPE
jgi:signal peptidase I